MNNNENLNENTQIENSNPLSVRIDTQYKEMFNNIINEKGITKKQLMESMIINYIQDDLQQGREEQISFSNEINLISTSLEEVFKIFKVITSKSQDTMASKKDQYEQKLKNMSNQIESLMSNVSELDEKNNLLQLTNDSYNLEKEKLLNTINEANIRISKNNSDIEKLNKKNQELLEQINSLRYIESQNLNLINENEKRNQDFAKLNSILKDKNTEIDSLSRKDQHLSKLLDDFTLRKQEEFKEIEKKIKNEVDIEKKIELLQMQSKFNDLQEENLKNIGIINEKSSEIIELKERIIKSNIK